MHPITYGESIGHYRYCHRHIKSHPVISWSTHGGKDTLHIAGSVKYY